MSTKIKLPAFCITILMLFFIFLGKVNAQSCEDSFYKARDYYYKGQFDIVPDLLHSCIRDFNGKSKRNYQTRNPAMVFRVYKLITSSYYQMDLDYEAEAEETRLIRFFNGIYDPNLVLDRLAYTEF